MTNIQNLKIYIVDLNANTCEKLRERFVNAPNVEITNDTIEHFYDCNRDKIDCLTSPANAFGIMSGGFDAGLSNILGWKFQQKVQQYIKDHFFGEQGVATSFIIKTDIPSLSLIHTPTMRRPTIIKDDLIVYYCMRSTLICALQNDIKSLVIPVFGGSCGGLSPEITSKRMHEAYLQMKNNSTEI